MAIASCTATAHRADEILAEGSEKGEDLLSPTDIALLSITIARVVCDRLGPLAKKEAEAEVEYTKLSATKQCEEQLTQAKDKLRSARSAKQIDQLSMGIGLPITIGFTWGCVRRRLSAATQNSKEFTEKGLTLQMTDDKGKPTGMFSDFSRDDVPPQYALCLKMDDKETYRMSEWCDGVRLNERKISLVDLRSQEGLSS